MSPEEPDECPICKAHDYTPKPLSPEDMEIERSFKTMEEFAAWLEGLRDELPEPEEKKDV